MRYPSYISKSRHGVYYLRIVTPKAARAANPQLPREIRRSLKTRSVREAVVRLRAMALDWPHLHSMESVVMSSNDKYNTGFIVTKSADGSVTYKFEESDTSARAKEHIQMLRAIGELPPNASIIEVMAREQPSDEEFLETKLKAIDVKPGGPWLSDVIEAFAAEKLQKKEWEPNTWTQTYRPILRDFREIISKNKRTVTNKDGTSTNIWDITCTDIEEEEIDDFCAAMWRFPRNYGSMKGGGDAKQALNSGLPPQDRSNAFKKMRMVKTFLIWAYKKKKLSQALDELLPVEKLDKKRDTRKDGYQPWTLDELKIIFERESYPIHPEWKFWTPILGLFTGARLNEISQLQVTDFFRTDSGIDCISVTDLEDEPDYDEPIEFEVPKKHIKTVKNVFSRRWVPIHPKLIEIGLLDFVEGLRAKKEVRLFPDLPYVEESRYGRKVSRYFSESAKRLGVHKKHKKVFHSFRSTLNGTLLTSR